MAQSLMTELKRITDPLFDGVSAEQPISSDPILGSIGIKTINEADVPISLIVELYGPTAKPAIHIGDRWGYAYSARSLNTGEMKMKKATIAVKVTEDEIAPIMAKKQEHIITDMVLTELKYQNDALRLELQRIAIGNFTAATEWTTDPKVFGIFGTSSTGTITNPSDLCVSAGTPTNLTAIIWSGSEQTSRNVESLLANLIPRWGLFKDTNTGRAIPATNFTLYVPVYMYRVLQSNKDIKDANAYTTSNMFYIQEFAAAGVTVVSCEQLTSPDATPDGEAATAVFVSDPKKNFFLWLGKPQSGMGWTEWEEIFDGNARAFVKSKKVLFGFEIAPYLINDVYYSPKQKFTSTPWDNTP